MGYQNQAEGSDDVTSWGRRPSQSVESLGVPNKDNLWPAHVSISTTIPLC